MAIERYRQYGFIRNLKRKLFYNNSLVKKNQDCRCLVVLHLFYEKSWIEINEYLKSLAPYSFDLIITATKNRISSETFDRIKQEYPKAQILIMENRGFDLLPFLTVIKNMDLSKYDVVFKLQSKSTKRKFIHIYRQLFLRRDWFVNLYEGILSGKNVHQTIDALYNKEEIGLVAAANLIVRDPKHKENLIQIMAKQRGLACCDEYSFVAGTCFAIKAKCLKAIQDFHFENEEFESWIPSRGLSFAHFVERYLCISVLLQGYQMQGNPANTIRRFLLKPITLLMNHYSSERLFHEDIVLDDKWFLWHMDNRLIVYKFVPIQIKDIKCLLGNRVFRLIEGAPYKYISEGDISGYERYCEFHKDNGLPLMTKERFDGLIESIDKDGYDERYISIIDDQNVLLDGQHRICILANKYGVESYIRVLKIWDIKRIVVRMLVKLVRYKA